MSTDRWFRRYLYGCGSIAAAVRAVAVASNPPEPVGALVGAAIALWVTLVVALLIPYGAVAVAISIFVGLHHAPGTRRLRPLARPANAPLPACIRLPADVRPRVRGVGGRRDRFRHRGLAVRRDE